MRSINTLAAVAVGILLGSCQSSNYSSGMDAILLHVQNGELEQAKTLLDEAIAQKPEAATLLILERAVLHQRLGNYKASRDDFLRADEDFEVIDFSGDPGDDFALLLARPKSAEYRGTPYEKILLNTLNTINHLALADLEDGRVEARRAMVMRDSIVEFEQKHEFENPLAQLLYGLLFEASSRPNEAHFAYKNVFEQTGAEFLKPRLISAAAEVGHSDLNRWESEFGSQPPHVPDGHGTVVVLVMNGRAPIRRATTTPDRKIRYAALAAQPREHGVVQASIGSNSAVSLVSLLDIEDQALSYFERVEQKTLAGARLKSLTSSGGSRMHNIADTRSWNSLPAEVLVGVMAAPAGTHTVKALLSGSESSSLSDELNVQAGGMHIVQFYVSE